MMANRSLDVCKGIKRCPELPRDAQSSLEVSRAAERCPEVLKGV